MCVALCSLALAGCGVRPSVTYSKITKESPPASDLADSFYLQSSTITIEDAAAAKGDEKAPTQLAVTSKPVEYPAFKLGIKGNSSWLGMANTTVNITKIENTAVVKSIGSETTDNRAADLEAIGKTVASLIPLVALTASTDTIDRSKLPWSVKAYVPIEADPEGADAGRAIPLKDGVTMTLGALPVDAQPLDRLRLLASTDAFVYAACRDATISFVYADTAGNRSPGKRFTKTVKIADPRYFQVVAFPVKGSITMHSECGVSVTTGADPSSSAFDLAKVLAAQGVAIKAAIDASKKK